MTVNKFQIIPFKGVDLGDKFFELGKTNEQIIAEFGEASEVVQNNLLNISTEYRFACELKYRADKLVAVICNKHTNPMLGGLNFFTAENLEKIKQQNDFIEEKSYITFPELGICIGGMSQKRIPEGKAAIVFAKEETKLTDFWQNKVKKKPSEAEPHEVKISSFEGVETNGKFFKLGNTMQQIIAEFGNAERVSQHNILRCTFEIRGSCELQYKENRLVAITCDQYTHPIFNGLNLFEADSIEKLKKEHHFLEGKHYLTFPSLGICIGGMSPKRIPEGKIALVFAQSETGIYEFYAED